MKPMDFEEDEDDELPAVEITSRGSDLSSLVMPSAAELARQRERELSTERALAELRAAAAPVPLQHCDSSGSEGEVVMLAVAGLQLRPAADEQGARMRAALRALAPPSDAAPDLTGPLPRITALLTEHEVKPHTPAAARLTQAVHLWCGEAVSAGAAWAAAWCCLVAALPPPAPPPAARAARRTAHHLLDIDASEEQVREIASSLSEVMTSAFADAEEGDAGAARALVRCADAARSGGGARADRLADLLLGAALRGLLRARGDDGGECGCGACGGGACGGGACGGGACGGAPCVAALGARAGWRRLGAARGAHGAALAAVARLLAHRPRPAPAALHALLQPPPHKDADKFTPGKLKVDVTLKKLQVLFGAPPPRD